MPCGDAAGELACGKGIMIFLDIIISRGVIARELQGFCCSAHPGGWAGGRSFIWPHARVGFCGPGSHHFHGRPWVATFDPRLAGGVVVFSHTPEKSVGDVVVVIDGAKVDFEWGGTNAS